MRNLNYKAITILFSLLMVMTASIFLLPVSAAPRTSQGIDLTIVVTDQQLPGVTNVTDEFLASSLGGGIDSVTVVSSGTNANDQLTFLSTAMAASSTDYDVIGLDTIWTAQFASNGWIIDLDPYLDANELDDYGSGIVDACIYQGSTYAYPYFMNLGVMFYRTDLMDIHYGAGSWSEADFDTWEELNATANYILNNETGLLDNPDLVGYVGQFDAYEGGVVNFFEWVGSNGVLDAVTSAGDVNIDTQDVNDAMTFLKALVPPQYTGVQGTDFIIPRSGLVHDEGSSVGVWLANNSIFMRQWPFAYGLSEDNGIEFGIAPLPHFTGASGYRTSCIGGAILSIPSTITGAQRQAAINLTKFLGDQVAQEAELNADSSGDPGVQPLGNFPALKSIYDSPPTGFEWIQNWTEQLDLTLSRPVHEDYPQISNTIADYFSDLLSCQKSVDDALSEMQTDVEDIVVGSPTLPAIPGYSLSLLILAIAGGIGIVIAFKRKKL